MKESLFGTEQSILNNVDLLRRKKKKEKVIVTVLAIVSVNTDIKVK